jgi:glucosamine 6-phosphate synthetase-like amidotransferase/phosphosugar isomerase protein
MIIDQIGRKGFDFGEVDHCCNIVRNEGTDVFTVEPADERAANLVTQIKIHEWRTYITMTFQKTGRAWHFSKDMVVYKTEEGIIFIFRNMILAFIVITHTCKVPFGGLLTAVRIKKGT